MTDWLSTYAQNLKLYALPPMVLMTLVCVAVIWHGLRARSAKQLGTPEFFDSRWRVMACAQGLVAGWLLYLLLAAVPAPDYKTKTVYRNADAAKLYQKTYDQCWSSRSERLVDRGGMPRLQLDNYCDARAMALARPEVARITRTVFKPAPPAKVVYRERVVVRTAGEQYLGVFQACMDGRPRDQPGDTNRSYCGAQTLAILRPDVRVVTRVAYRQDGYRALYSHCLTELVRDATAPPDRAKFAAMCHAQAMAVRASTPVLPPR